MKGTAITFRPGMADPVVEELTTAPTLELLKAGVGGGYIEVVPGFRTIVHCGVRHDCVAFCDENGKINGQPINLIATNIWHAVLPPPGLIRDGALVDHLVGQVIVVFGDQEFMDAL